MRFVSGALLALVLSPLAPVAAQQQSGVDIGQHVRLSTDMAGQQTIIGRVVARDSATIKVAVLNTERRWDPGAPDSIPITVPWARVREVAVRTGRRPNAGKGALIGCGLVGGLGLAAGIATANEPWVEGSAGDIVAFTGLSCLVGAGIGALVGSAKGTDEWSVVQ